MGIALDLQNCGNKREKCERGWPVDISNSLQKKVNGFTYSSLLMSSRQALFVSSVNVFCCGFAHLVLITKTTDGDRLKIAV